MDDLYDGPCEAGCKSFHGGEKKHHPDCGHYPESLTKLNADRIEELEAKLAKAVEGLDWVGRRSMILEADASSLRLHARMVIAKLKGKDDG